MKPNASPSTVCPTCNGSGWILYQVSPQALVDVYGVLAEAQDYAKPCPDCKRTGGKYRDTNVKDLTGVPEAFRFVDISKFKYDVYTSDTSILKRIVKSFVEDYDKWENEGRGLYLWSKEPGSGKTFLASCLGKSIMQAKDKLFKFITAPDYMNVVGESYKREPGVADPSLVYRNCDLLVLDDIGAQMSKEWQQQEMFRLIDERMKNQKVTIYTSNYPLDKLNLDERVKSRISAMSVMIQMPEESVREKQSAAARKDFLSRVLEREN